MPLLEFILKHLLMADCLQQRAFKESPIPPTPTPPQAAKYVFSAAPATQPFTSWHEGGGPDTNLIHRASHEGKGETFCLVRALSFFVKRLLGS